MGVTIKVNCKELKEFSKKIGNLNGMQRELFFQEAAKTLASHLLSLVIPRTPVKTGVLRRGWGAAYSQVGNVERNGNGYTVTVTNPIHYASYVEYGHRQTPGRYVPAIGKRLKASWVEGQFFLKLSEDSLRGAAPGILQTRLDAFLRTVF